MIDSLETDCSLTSIIEGNGIERHRGTLRMRVGPMFSDKSTWLNTELTKKADIGEKVLKISPLVERVAQEGLTVDDGGSTHNSSYTILSRLVDRVQVNNLSEANYNGYKYVGIDEAQRFDDLVEVVNDLVENHSIHVLVVGLDGDFEKRPIGHVLELIPMADEALKKSNHCEYCLKELRKANYKGNASINGSFSKRVVNSTEVVLLGGKDQYKAACRYHHAMSAAELQNI